MPMPKHSRCIGANEAAPSKGLASLNGATGFTSAWIMLSSRTWLKLPRKGAGDCRAPRDSRMAAEPRHHHVGRIGLPQIEKHLTDRPAQQGRKCADDRRPKIAMADAVDNPIAAQEVHERLHIHGDLGETEDHQTERAAQRRFQGDAWSHVKRGERHGRTASCWRRCLPSAPGGAGRGR
jgi:hypothetical protein